MTNTRAPISRNMYIKAVSLLLREFKNVEVEHNHMDVFGFNLGGDSVEIEVKINCYDFNKEFTKPCKKAKHRAYKYHAKMPLGFCPTRYYFFVPKNLAIKALSRIKKELPHYGLIIWDETNQQERVIRKAKKLHDKPFKGITLDFPFKDYLKHYRKLEQVQNERR